jgi:NodT family efflux transporter outer membrane factor (OMF) lipoprotein
MKRWLVVSVCLLPLALTGCSLHKPQAITPPAPVPETFAEAAPASTDQPTGRWWLYFNDPELSALIEKAFAASPELDQAVARLEQAEAALRVARAARLPAAGLDAAGGRAGTLGLPDLGARDSFTLSAAASFELDLWGKLAARTAASRLDTAAAGEEVKTLYLTLSARVADLYFQAVEQRAQLQLADRTIASFADTHDRVERRYREGLVPALDLYQSRQNLTAARARRPPLENTLAAAEHALAILLGRFPEKDLTGGATLPAEPPFLPAGLPSRLLVARPDIAAALLRLKASDERLGAAVAERFPDVSLSGNYGSTSAELGDLFTSGKIFWSLLINLTQPLYDGGQREAEVDRNQALFRENLGRYHQAVLTAFREVEDALAANRTGEERIGHLRARVDASAAALRLALDRYLLGLSDYLPVLTAQGLLFDAESQLLAARGQLIADRITLARALGGDWMDAQLEDRLTQSAAKGSPP